MRHALVVVGVLVAAASVAQARSAPPAWTVAKANVMLPEVALIAMPPDPRASLDSELSSLLARFRLLELTAQDRGDWLAAGTYANYVRRFSEARERVRKGLSIDAARCVGTGTALKGKRYRNFRCRPTSYVLEIPNVQLGEETDGRLPEVIEGPIRRYGPYTAVFTLRVTGPTACTHRRVA